MNTFRNPPNWLKGLPKECKACAHRQECDRQECTDFEPQGVFYMKVTNDKYELPLCVADNFDELAEFTGRPAKGLMSTISRSKHSKNGRCIYVRVEIGGQDDEREII